MSFWDSIPIAGALAPAPATLDVNDPSSIYKTRQNFALFGSDALTGFDAAVKAAQLRNKPPDTPDLTDDAVRQAALMQRQRLMIGGGQGGTFLTGMGI